MSARQRLAIAIPIVLVPTMAAAFRMLTLAFGYPLGYLAAFAVYWCGWCVAVPLAILGPTNVAALFGRSRAVPDGPGIGMHALVWWPIVVPLVAAFIPRVGRAGAGIVAVSVLLGIVTGSTEELLWRGVYLRLFPDNVGWGRLYPSVAFGLWHLAPLGVLPSRYPGGAAGFVAYSTVLGLSYATAARKTGSIRWCALSHCIHDALGLGGFAYASWLS